VATLATLVEFLHALLIVAWVVGMPLLFWHRWPRLSRAYAAYAIVFVVANLASAWLIGECFITTLTRYLWVHAASHPANTNEWFTVRFADLVFGLSPSHRSIRLVTKMLIFASALGVLHTGLRHRRTICGRPHVVHPRA